MCVLDKTKPVVVTCPGPVVQLVNNNSRLSQVEWEEPVFNDDSQIIHILKTHRPGKYGEYFLNISHSFKLLIYHVDT